MTVQIELLVVPDCPNETVASDLIQAAVADAGVVATVTRTIVATDEQAHERHFVGSPTILVNGIDPFAEPGASVGLACRLYATPDGLGGVPTLSDLCQAVERAAAV